MRYATRFRTFRPVRWLLVVCLFAGAAVATSQEPAPPPRQEPSYPGALTGDDAEAAARLEKEIDMLLEQGDVQQAIAKAEELLALRTSRQGMKHWATVNGTWLKRNLQKIAPMGKDGLSAWNESVQATADAAALYAQGKYVASQLLLEKALRISERLFGDDHPETAKSYHNLATNLDARGKHATAQPLLEKALEIRLRLLGEDHPETAKSYNNLAVNLDYQGRSAEAQPVHEKALELRKRLVGDHPLMAASYNNIAFNLNAQGQYAEAQPFHEKALEIRKRLLGDDHPDTAESYNNVGGNLRDQGKHADARPLVEKALETRKRLLGEDHPDMVMSYNSLADNLNAQGKYTEAWAIYQKAGRSFLAARGRVAFGGAERVAWAAEHSPLARMAAAGARQGHFAEACAALEQDLGRGLWDDISLRSVGLLTSDEREPLLAAERELQQLDQALGGKLEEDARRQIVEQRSKASLKLGEVRVALMEKHGPLGGDVFELAAVGVWRGCVERLRRPTVGDYGRCQDPGGGLARRCEKYPHCGTGQAGGNARQAPGACGARRGAPFPANAAGRARRRWALATLACDRLGGRQPGETVQGRPPAGQDAAGAGGQRAGPLRLGCFRQAERVWLHPPRDTRQD